MTVGILTFPNSVSYGASLQMYALSRTVSSLGCKAETIHYHNQYMKNDLHCGSNSLTPGALRKRRFKKNIRRILHARLYRKFRLFEKTHINLYPSQSFHEKQMLAEVGKRYDAVICGSDQVWNPHITNHDLSYFLDFCGSGTKRVSYAPSCGIEEFSEDYCKDIARELSKFTAISVREEVCADLVGRLLDKDVPVVVDPTILIDKEDWIKLEKPCRLTKEPYILYYTVKGSARLLEYAHNLAKENNKKLIIVGGNAFSKIKNPNSEAEYASDIGPEEWLYLVHHADLVVTNSFHGTAFSIIYRKNFYVEFSSLTNSRLYQITKTFGLENRVVADKSTLQITDTDYSKTESVLPVLREEGISFLRKALFEDKSKF